MSPDGFEDDPIARVEEPVEEPADELSDEGDERRRDNEGASALDGGGPVGQRGSGGDRTGDRQAAINRENESPA
ncbi:MAG TPA: hypothetical protein VGL60_04200 [Acidimicrobiales bacterium]|jgi:hypothetical protein